MPVTRAKDCNLYNHCIQVKKPINIKLSFIEIKDYQDDLNKLNSIYTRRHNSWICKLLFSHNNLSYSYIACNKRKKLAKIDVLSEAEDELLRIINE